MWTLQIEGQLAPLATSREARVAQWHALSREILQRTGSAKVNEPAAKPLKQLPADGAGCVELFISAPGRRRRSSAWSRTVLL